MTKYKAKKDVILYHPHKIIWKKDSVLESDQPPIIVGNDRVVITDDEKYNEYIKIIEE